ncbi:MAG TPA: hypothetical protein VGB18_05330, partial [Candidatus Thermoplasmatota archaeon]
LCDCAEITQTAANFMLRGSELHLDTCKACEEVCEAVVEACEKSDLDEIEDFTEQVQTCADQCRAMANAGAGGTSEGTFQRSGRAGREESARSGRTEKTTETGKGRGRSITKGVR